MPRKKEVNAEIKQEQKAEVRKSWSEMSNVEKKRVLINMSNTSFLKHIKQQRQTGKRI